MTPSDELAIVAGQVDQASTPTAGPATSSDLDDPAGVAVDGAGNLYVADDGNDVVEKITSAGCIPGDAILRRQTAYCGRANPP